jgi:hypothetical protein
MAILERKRHLGKRGNPARKARGDTYIPHLSLRVSHTNPILYLKKNKGEKVESKFCAHAMIGPRSHVSFGT